LSINVLYPDIFICLISVRQLQIATATTAPKTPAMTAQQITIRPAKSLQEAHDTWWPFMQSLGWVRQFNRCLSLYAFAAKEFPNLTP